METPKQKAIREAWCERYDRWKDEINENGWLEIYAHNSFTCETYINRIAMFSGCLEGWQRKHEFWGELISIRPMCLKGISSNNGWIRTDERLPENEDTVIVLDGSEQREAWYGAALEYWVCNDEQMDPPPTHWRPKERYPKPIY